MFKLDNITQGIENLTSLTTLPLGGGCSSLTTLPKELGNLTSLMKLDLEGCSSIDNITRGTLEPLFLDMAWFVVMFKLDNIT